MSTLNELRATLEEHAESIHDTEGVTRAASVRQRARVVRRRRVAAVAAAAAVVVVAGVAVAGRLDADPEPVPAEQWHGVKVPGEVELAAGTYELDEVQDVEPGQEVALSYPDGERLAISLVASGLEDGRATLLVNDYPMARLVDGRTLSSAIEAAPWTVKVRLEGAPADARVGYALYQGPSDGLPQGEGHAEPAFLERVDDRVLAGWASAGPGESAEVTVEAPLDEITVATLCTADDGEVVTVLDGGPEWSEPCNQQVWGDGTTNVFGGDSFGVESTDGEHSFTVSATDPDVAVSVGIYVRGDGRDVIGTQVAEMVEWMGRFWTLDEVTVPDEAPEAVLTKDIEVGAEERLIRFVSYGPHELELTSGLGRPCQVPSLAGGDITDFCSPMLLPGDTYHLEAGGDGIGLALLVYRPA